MLYLSLEERHSFQTFPHSLSAIPDPLYSLFLQSTLRRGGRGRGREKKNPQRGAQRRKRRRWVRAAADSRHDSGCEQLPRGSSRRPKHRGRPGAQCGPGGAEVEGFDSRYEPLNHRTSSLRTATMQSGRLTVNVFRYGEYVSGGLHVIIYTPLLHAEMELYINRMRCIKAPFRVCCLFLASCCVTIRRGEWMRVYCKWGPFKSCIDHAVRGRCPVSRGASCLAAVCASQPSQSVVHLAWFSLAFSPTNTQYKYIHSSVFDSVRCLSVFSITFAIHEAHYPMRL